MTNEEILARIRHNITNQDNLGTAHPMYAVKQIERVYGFDEAYADHHEWISIEGAYAATEELAADFDAQYEESGDTPDDYERVYYKDFERFVTACFTQEGADAFIALDGHNLSKPFVYIYSGYHNFEWQAIRQLLGAVGDE